jgi:hypothetical protein
LVILITSGFVRGTDATLKAAALLQVVTYQVKRTVNPDMMGDPGRIGNDQMCRGRSFRCLPCHYRTAGCADTKSSPRGDSTNAAPQTQTAPTTTTAASPARKHDKLEGIPLAWEPTTKLPKGGAIEFVGSGMVKIQIDPITDTREDPSFLGQNLERKVARKVTTPDNVAAFVTEKVKMLISCAGFYVVDSGGTVIVKTDIKSFSVDETQTYKGNVSLAVSVTSLSDALLWNYRGAYRALWTLL